MGTRDIKQMGRLGVGLLAGLAAGAAPGQQSDQPGSQLFLDLRTGIVVTDNEDRVTDPDGTSTILGTDLILGYDSITKAEQFNLRLGTRIEYADVPEDVDFVQGRSDPFLTVGYTRSSKTARLTFDGSIRERENSISFDSELETGDDLIVETVRRRDISANLGLETGMEGPFGIQARLFYNATQFEDDPEAAELNESERYGASLALRMNVNRTTQLSFSSSYSRQEEDDGFDTVRTLRSHGVSMSVQADPSLVLTAGVSYDENVVDRRNGGIDSRNDGFTYRLGAVKTVKNGTFGVQAFNRLTDDTTLTTLEFSRSLALKSGALEASIGATWDEDNDPNGIARLRYTQDFKAARLQATLNRTVTTNSDDDEEVFTSVGITYLQRVTQVSDVQFQVSHSQADALDRDGVDRENSQVSFTYSHRLTEDWSLNAGVSRSISSASDRDPIAENRIFTNIGRRFSLRP